VGRRRFNEDEIGIEPIPEKDLGLLAVGSAHQLMAGSLDTFTERGARFRRSEDTENQQN
jgi:hypothetical protein